MADKEATVFVVDVGRSMGERRHGRRQSDLDFGMRYVWGKILAGVSTGRKTLNFGVVGVRTDETENELNEDDEYQNIAVWSGLGQVLLPQLHDLRNKIRVSSTDDGDVIDALVVAIDMMEKFTKKLKYIRRIVIVTNARGSISPSELDRIASRLVSDSIELVVVGIDFDDPEFGFKEESKDLYKAENERVLKSLTDQCDGVIGTAAEAVESLEIPTVKTPKPYKTYAGLLTLGDPSAYDTAMSIGVERYFRTKVASAPTASNVVVNMDGQAELASAPSASAQSVSAVKVTRAYRVTDETAPGGKRDVDREDLARGYMYGSTVVPIAESDQNVTKLETKQSFEIIGFIPAESYKPYLSIGTSCITVPSPYDERTKLAFSSLVRALYELESCAIARIVLKEGKEPQLLLLAPLIEPELEALIDVPLPFAEDVRPYRFPPLDHVLTVSGAKLMTHRFLPTEELTDAMSAYVDSMDLSELETDDDGAPKEYATIEESYSPLLHRLNHAVQQRAVYPNGKPAPPADLLVKFSKPPAVLVEASRNHLQKLISAADVKKVPPRVKGKRKDIEKPLSNLDVDALLRSNKKTKISTNNTVPDFKQMLETAEDIDGIHTAAAQMSTIIQALITNSLGDSGYGQALEDMKVMRGELVDYEEPGLYNDFARDLKKHLLEGRLGGDRRDLWWEIRKMKLGLISQAESSLSTVSEAEMTEFYQQKMELADRSK